MLRNAPVYAYIPARDLARARNFYEGKLGFKPKEVLVRVGDLGSVRSSG